MSDLISQPTELRISKLARAVEAIPPGRRAAVLQSVVSFRPNRSIESSFAIGTIRAAFSEAWEFCTGQPVPIERFRSLLDPPVPIGTVMEFSKLALPRDLLELERFLTELLKHLATRLESTRATSQRPLFDVGAKDPARPRPPVGESVTSLRSLIEAGRKFPTIYADPPWPYDNEASRAAAVNHYPVLALREIENEPVCELAEANAHLHLWTTNAFLHDSFRIIDAWGFEFKSCLVWVKSELGMANYWRVSHEFLLLGVRGSLTFRDRTLPSWIQAERTIHSRKPRVVRSLIERASPGPYLELYGREDLPDSAWTVYGNQIERGLF